jgi:hypothetical protein
MPGSPPTTTRLGLPRYAQTDAAQFSPQVNAIVDALDPITARTDDTRFTNARTPTAHASTHQPGGSDAMAVDAAAATASLRTLGTGANQAAAGNDARLRGGDFASISGLQVSDVGLVNQIRAGRQLTVADFTSIGLIQPIVLFNLSDLTSIGSQTTALTNKGTVPFAAGINGVATTAAQFKGDVSQALYLTTASTPYAIRMGSWGCWSRTAKRGVWQYAFSRLAAAPIRAWGLAVSADTVPVAKAEISLDGTAITTVTGISDIADDRWHHLVATYDGTLLRLYVDGVLEGTTAALGLIYNVPAGTTPINVGSAMADATNAAGGGAGVAGFAHFGRVDEAFLTPDLLSEDQVRCLYAARLPHTLGTVPSEVRLNVTRRRKGPVLLVSDFATQPLRLYNYTAQSLTDEGSNGQTTTSAGTSATVVGPDGSANSARYLIVGQAGLNSTDTGLPDLLATRSYGLWFKVGTSITGFPGLIGWGAGAGFAAGAALGLTAAGLLNCQSGADAITGSTAFVADAQWHFAVVVEDNTAGDGVKRKLYLDGRLVGGSTVLNSLTLGGANRFRIGALPDATNPCPGTFDAVFVTNYALTSDDVVRFYAKGGQSLGASPKNPGDHVERVSTTDVLFIGDTLESQYTVDLGVVA